jgi:hypothetical protein
MEMTDRELLELAAKAAGIEGDFRDAGQYWFQYGIPLPKTMSHEPQRYWNPLTNDTTAFHLAVKLGIDCWREGDVICCDGVRVDFGDPYAATRRAIVRAAAEIGKGME